VLIAAILLVLVVVLDLKWNRFNRFPIGWIPLLLIYRRGNVTQTVLIWHDRYDTVQQLRKLDWKSQSIDIQQNHKPTRRLE